MEYYCKTCRDRTIFVESLDYFIPVIGIIRVYADFFRKYETLTCFNCGNERIRVYDNGDIINLKPKRERAK